MNIVIMLAILAGLFVLGLIAYLRYDRNRWRDYALNAESAAWAWHDESIRKDRQIASMQEYLYTVSLSQQITPTGDSDKQTQLSLPLPIVAIRKDGSIDPGVESSNGKDKNGKDKNGKDKNGSESIESVITHVESILGTGLDQRGKDKIAQWHNGKGKNSPAEYAKRIKAMGAITH